MSFPVKSGAKRKAKIDMTTYLFAINAFIRQHQNLLDMLDDMTVIDRYRLPQGYIVKLLNAIGPHLMDTRRMEEFCLVP